MNTSSYHKFLQIFSGPGPSFLLSIFIGLTVCQVDQSVSQLLEEGSMELRGCKGHPTISQTCLQL